MDLQEIKILVAIDFGTTYSSFAYVSKENPENIIINSSWPGREGCYKTPTVLKYNESYTQVISWGNSALPDYMVDNSEERSHPIKLFKLHLLNLRKKELPWMPPQLNYKKAIEDYLTQMQILIKSTLERKWPAISFPQQVGLILTIPSESPHYMKAMRECVYNAGFLTTLNSANLEFITEQEAVVLHCLSVVKDHNLHSGDSFLVADCGDDTVDIILRKFPQNNKLDEITKRVGNPCGSKSVDKEFLHFIGRKVGFGALGKLKKYEYGQLQHLVQQFFCSRIKFKFNEDPKKFRTLKLKLQQYCPSLMQYVSGGNKEQMEEAGWIVKLDFESVKVMFDPVVDRVIKLIDDQLNDAKKRCRAIFLVGEFSESPYLLSRVREAFIDQVPIISVPEFPTVAVVRGAITYGLNVKPIHDLSDEATSVHRIYGMSALREFNISDGLHQYVGSGPFLDVISDWFRTFFRRHLDRNNVRKFDLYGSLKCVVYSVEFYYKKNGILLLKKSYKISSS
ncbi:hypothetical protein GLOIN_2v1784221 [Rhizophagus irregularis DAOM 181602=DAOM 197198]|nr:hypothetical protein GLOIN_2v1784221 [Rhizophagus irregularis DAOM 181602=DAOM 197198]CAB5126082.1 unnamed protein product [Rhizophagus irregularis]